MHNQHAVGPWECEYTTIGYANLAMYTHKPRLLFYRQDFTATNQDIRSLSDLAVYIEIYSSNKIEVHIRGRSCDRWNPMFTNRHTDILTAMFFSDMELAREWGIAPHPDQYQRALGDAYIWFDEENIIPRLLPSPLEPADLVREL